MDQIELAYLLGAFKDGSVYKNDKEKIYRIRIYQKSKKWLQELAKIFQKVFNTKLYLRKDPRKELWYLEINKKILFNKLSKLLSDPIPKIIKKGPIKIKLSYIQGFFDAEGGILRIENYESDEVKLKKKLQDIRVRFGQANREVLEFVKKTLEQINIECGKICGPFFKTKTSKPYYEFNCYGIENLRRFSSLIGSRHPTKLMRISKINAYT